MHPSRSPLPEFPLAHEHAPTPQTRRPVLVREATAAETVSTARLHVQCLSLGLFPLLGATFVARWHRAHVQSPHGVVLVAVDQESPDRVVGFVVGATDRGAFRAELLTRHRPSLLLHGVRALVLRPRVLRHFLRTRLSAYLRRLRRVRPGPSVPAGAQQPAPVADLTAIAVADGERRSGAGRTLTTEFLARCAERGASRVELVTATQSAGSVDFYNRTGWTARRRVPARDGQELQRFVWWFDRAQVGG